MFHPASLDLSDTVNAAVERIRREAAHELGRPIAVALTNGRLVAVDAIVAEVVERSPSRRSLTEAIGRLAVHPIAGWPVLAAVLYLVYLFVGVFGAGTLVDLLEVRLFGQLINPWVTRLVELLVPIELLQAFLVGEYGLITMALIGVDVEIQRFGAMPADRLSRLSIYGLTPGGRVTVVQRRPAPIVRVGETELALSEDILEQIWVRRPVLNGAQCHTGG